MLLLSTVSVCPTVTDVFTDYFASYRTFLHTSSFYITDAQMTYIHFKGRIWQEETESSTKIKIRSFISQGQKQNWNMDIWTEPCFWNVASSLVKLLMSLGQSIRTTSALLLLLYERPRTLHSAYSPLITLDPASVAHASFAPFLPKPFCQSLKPERLSQWNPENLLLASPMWHHYSSANHC